MLYKSSNFGPDGHSLGHDLELCYTQIMEQDFSNRIILVVRKDLESWQVANTIGHISAFLGNKIKNGFDTGEKFVTKDGVAYPRNSQYPIIVKRAQSNEQLHNLMEKVRAIGVLYHCFIREMIEHTNDTNLQKALDSKIDADIEYLGVGLFGKTEELNQLTKKFGLWE